MFFNFDYYIVNFYYFDVKNLDINMFIYYIV